MNAFESLLHDEIRKEAATLRRAALLAAAVAGATIVLLGLSGWFITAAGAAGLAGAATARVFNYMLPSAGIRLLAIVRTGARYGERLASHAAAFAVLARVRPALFRSIAAAPVRQALALSTGSATARLVQDVGAIEGAVVRRSATWAAVAAVATGVALTAAAGPIVAGTLAAMTGLTLAVTFRHLAVGRQHGVALQRMQGEMRELLATQLSAAPELRCYAMQDTTIDQIARLDARLAATRRDQARVAARAEAIAAGMAGLGAVAAFVVALPAGVPLAALSALTAVTTIDGLAPLLRDRAARGATIEATERLSDLFRPVAAAVTIGPACNPTLALPGLSLTAPPDARIAITGVSGVGKTTLLETLLGLRTDGTDGIFVGGRPLVGMDPAVLRGMFAWCPQDAQLLAGSIRDNLLLARPDAHDAELWQALDDACLGHRIRLLPEGLDSWVGEDGSRLSGGERRRLCLARAYNARAPWLLLDEPTEALDGQTEQQVIQRLNTRLMRTQQGLIVVTHRAALLKMCTQHVMLSTNALRDLAA